MAMEDAAGSAEYDGVTQASLNSIYVKARELDRGHIEVPAKAAPPPGMSHAEDAITHASQCDAESHASSKGDSQGACSGNSRLRGWDKECGLEEKQTDASSHASDVVARASDS